ncbi:MAG: hypothetical protein ACTSRD_14810 [Promethearchaeota archaeon]
MLPPNSLNIMPILYPPWYHPKGPGFVVFMLVLLGVEIVFLVAAIRRTVYEFREPVRIWWKILLRILLVIGLLGIVALTVMMVTWEFLA